MTSNVESNESSVEVRRQRSALFIGSAITMPVALALWLGVYLLMPPISGMQSGGERLVFALKCSCVAILLCFVTAVEAVSHERLVSTAIDPLLGRESQRMKINLRYLQQTLEQLMVFIPGLLALAWYCEGNDAMRAVVATTLVWIIARWVYWIGYHRGALHRGPGLAGMAQSMIVLLYACAKFGNEVAGPVGASVPLLIFGGIEGYLVYMLKRAPTGAEDTLRTR